VLALRAVVLANTEGVLLSPPLLGRSDVTGAGRVVVAFKDESPPSLLDFVFEAKKPPLSSALTCRDPVKSSANTITLVNDMVVNAICS
jgi:hypothetical protein